MKIRTLSLFFVVLLIGVGVGSATVSYDTNFLYSNADRTLDELYDECVISYGEPFTNSDLLERVAVGEYVAKKHIKANANLTLQNNVLGIIPIYAQEGDVRVPLNGKVNIYESEVYTHGVNFRLVNGITQSDSMGGVIQTSGDVKNSTIRNMYKVIFGQVYPVGSTVYSEGQTIDNNYFYNISAYDAGDGLQAGLQARAHNFTFSDNIVYNSARGFRLSFGSNNTFVNNTFTNIGPLTESTASYAFQWAGRYNTIDGMYIDRVGYSGTNIGGEYWNIQDLICNDTRHNNLELQVRHSIMNNIISSHADDHQIFTTINAGDSYGESFNNTYSNITTSHGGSGFGILIGEGGHDHIIKDSSFTGPGIGITGSYNITIDNVTQWKGTLGLQSTYVGGYDEYPYNINISNSEFKLNTVRDFTFISTSSINLLNVGYTSKYMQNSIIDSEVGTYVPTIIWNTDSSKYDIDFEFLNSNNGIDYIDNEWVPTEGNYSSYNPSYGYWYRMPFIPNSTGALTHVSLSLSKYQTPNDGIEIEIMDDNSNVIGSKSMPASSVPTSHDIAKHTLDVPAWVEENETYYIVIRSNHTSSPARYYLWRCTSVPYTGPISGTQTSTNQGESWSNDVSTAISFRTHINPDYPVGTYNVIEEAENYFSFVLSSYHNVESVNMSFNFNGSSIASNDMVELWFASNNTIIENTPLSNYLGNFELSLDEGGYYVGVYSEPGTDFIISDFSPINTMPTTTVNTTQTFSIDLSDTATVTWLIDSVEVQTNTGVTSASYTNSTATAGTYNVTASATDGSTTVQQEWTWTVEEESTPVTITSIWDAMFDRAKSDTESTISLATVLPTIIIAFIIITILYGMSTGVIEFEIAAPALVITFIIWIILFVSVEIFNGLHI